MDPLTLGVVALMGVAATIGGAAEDLESDVGSQSNPNSQVQLAPQMGHLHRLINKAASGEPCSYGVWCGTSASVAFVCMQLGIIPIISIAIGSLIAAIVLTAYAVLCSEPVIICSAFSGLIHITPGSCDLSYFCFCYYPDSKLLSSGYKQLRHISR